MENLKQHTVILLIGSNIDPYYHLPRILADISQQFTITAQSVIYETLPVGETGSNFLNIAISIITTLDIHSLKNNALQNIEIRHGRKRSADKYAPRTADIDIIAFDDKVLESNLWQIAFIAVPVSDIAPELLNANTGELLKERAEQLKETSWIVAHPAL
ncbi:MAG: 2-amino-4-hydroxy-6-hydroxymethyldihydropteridine diphosphokinase [Anaerolinea sp.]|nr:2-amino-4-hydroxy-6-hydroxymethyldihydropteridine diphosphokinase [Anaerolinea sp.]